VIAIAAPSDAYADPTCSQCQADLDFDGFIDARDLGILLSAWNSLPALQCNARSADLNGDGQVDSADLAILLSAWGPCP
jgi:ABC-type transporter Mla MlaB component